MPYAIKNEPVPESVTSLRTNKALLAANFAVGLLNGILLYLSDTFANQHDGTRSGNAVDTLFAMSQFAVYVFQMISAAYVAFAVRRIRKFVETNKTGDQVEVSMLVKHVSALGLYFMGTLFFVIALFIDYITSKEMIKFLTSSAVLLNILSCLSQLVICWIFWNLAPNQQKKPQLMEKTQEKRKSIKQQPRFSEPVVIYEDLDENSDLQARLWN
jgi:preprotein translocase subunit Sss1